MIRGVALVLALWLLASDSRAGSAQVHFAYLEPYEGAQPRELKSYAMVCLGGYQDGHFVRSPEAVQSEAIVAEPAGGPVDAAKSQEKVRLWDAAMQSVLDSFRVGKVLTGVGARGRAIRGSVRATYLDGGNPYLELRTESATTQSEPVLLTDSALGIEVLKTEKVQLAKSVDETLRKRASAHTLGAAQATRVAGAPELLVVRYPVDVPRDTGDAKTEHAERASFSFIYSAPEQKIVRGELGHPELYFRIKGDSRIYFIGADEGGRESLSKAIFDLRTGQDLIHCY